jgi:hypothetical protein
MRLLGLLRAPLISSFRVTWSVFTIQIGIQFKDRPIVHRNNSALIEPVVQLNEGRSPKGFNQESGPRRARTVDPRIKSPLLYRLSYRPHPSDSAKRPNIFVIPHQWWLSLE